ncbi:MAG: AbrB/MazE/SpoVT family DNA-binding domain-containing protein [Limnohabitans sp.]|nr:AbrB/MazE/SpoVT family DNA-binding domain-containing protein [Limnohabitans sp.]
MTQHADTAKIFITGRSQAVRLPKAYRFDTAEVFIEKVGNTVILRPKQGESNDWGKRLQSILSGWQGMPEEIERDHTLQVDDIESLD